ncbi:hypothetical protein CesoFtcFv8_015847 [Champsocephalus esox]|uniref:Uncharacterized protein n=1 Tax=Champsocephalus esox TaxID=159716 RepID=A0AAN8GPP1_9TELE|nr:hypothetical protein CesoFtcFv8_015847 [Champsocephalus esox]
MMSATSAMLSQHLVHRHLSFLTGTLGCVSDQTLQNLPDSCSPPCSPSSLLSPCSQQPILFIVCSAANGLSFWL